jgi:hypothetical protein
MPARTFVLATLAVGLVVPSPALARIDQPASSARQTFCEDPRATLAGIQGSADLDADFEWLSSALEEIDGQFVWLLEMLSRVEKECKDLAVETTGMSNNVSSMLWCVMGLPPFDLADPEPTRPPECPLALNDRRKTVKVVILVKPSIKTFLAYRPLGREVAEMLSKAMQNDFKRNKEKVAVVKTSDVEDYKADHPDWRSPDLSIIGKGLGADYVIEVEINQFSLYEPGSNNTLYRGRCDISIVVHQMRNSFEGPKWNGEYSTEFPRARGPIDVSNGSVTEFRQKFLLVITRELSWRFTAHPFEDDYKLD